MSPHRLRRLPQIFDPHSIFFITACTDKRRTLLANASVHQAFTEFCEAAQARGIGVGRYILMPDHLHLFASFGANAPGVPMWMKSLKNGMSKTLRGLGVEGPHWQKGFFDHVLRSRESYAQKWTYVAANPVRKGLVTRTEDWPFQGEIVALEFREL